MQEALTPELGTRCGNPECNRETPENRSPAGRARYCSSPCATKAARLRRAQRHATAGSKVCPRCQEDKAIELYHAPGHIYCRECANAMKRDRYQAKGGKEAVYAQNLRNNYGMTVEEYQARMERQGGRGVRYAAPHQNTDCMSTTTTEPAPSGTYSAAPATTRSATPRTA